MAPKDMPPVNEEEFEDVTEDGMGGPKGQGKGKGPKGDGRGHGLKGAEGGGWGAAEQAASALAEPKL